MDIELVIVISSCSAELLPADWTFKPRLINLMTVEQFVVRDVVANEPVLTFWTLHGYMADRRTVILYSYVDLHSLFLCLSWLDVGHKVYCSS